MSFSRALVSELEAGLCRHPVLIQVVVGPRQVGKTTAAGQVAQRLGWPRQVVSADAALPHPPEWIETQWHLARRLAPGQTTLLVLDEIQKIPGWSEVVKRLWDEEVASVGNVRPLLLGSSALLMQRGLTESLAGRFFLHRCPHWSWSECREAFGWSLEQWLYFGGYPGAAPFAGQEPIWKSYVHDSLIETVLARDVLQLQTVNKPALLRHLFGLASAFPAQILSYNKMLGQLTDAGNTTTLANYLRLLETAFLVSGLEQFSRNRIRRRASSPKLILWNNALINAPSLRSFPDTQADGAWWGRLVENAVGAHLLNHLPRPLWEISHWREGNAEVDFVVTQADRIWALEVKSGRPGRTSGWSIFKARYPTAQTWLIGESGVPLTDFLGRSPLHWLS